MAVPKRKTSKTRKNWRRSHHALAAPGRSKCANCGAAKLPHRVCGECGHYRGVERIQVGEDKA
jgi:large subunit ribosomal protein L32